MTSPNTPLQGEQVPVPDGGEEYTDYGEVADEPADEYIEHYPDPFAEEEPGPLHDGYLPEYEPDPHLTPGLEGEDDPPWGFEEDSARPRGPPCESCDEYTRAESFGWAPDTGETVDWAVCDDCGLGWGPIEGWVDLEGDANSAEGIYDEC